MFTKNKKKFQKKIVRMPNKKDCVYCNKKTLPSFKEAESLRKYLSIRGKIVSRDRSGLCAKHQRVLATEIKRARTLMLLPYVSYEA
ncbi:MAG: 30S ribosomal protein S18 [Patescibacteria group bacterium]